MMYVSLCVCWVCPSTSECASVY